MYGQGHVEQAESILAGMTLDAMSIASRVWLARIRASNLHWGLDAPDAAEAVLLAAEAEITDPAYRDELICLRAKFLQYAGWCAEASELAATILGRPHPTDTAISESLTVRSATLGAVGKYGQARTVAQQGINWERRRRGDAISLATDEMHMSLTCGYLWSGRLASAYAIASARYRRSVSMNWPLGTAAWAVWLAESARAGGDITVALHWSREAAALVRTDMFRHPYNAFVNRFVLGCHARTAAQAGELAEARVALTEADACGSPSSAVMESFYGPIRAWVAVASGEITTGIELALTNADVERRRGNAGFEIIALHDVVRLGAPNRVVDRLTQLAPQVEGRLAPLYAAHVRALVANDGTALDTIAAALTDLGYLLLAAEATVHAATAHREAGRPRLAKAAATLARHLVPRCPGAHTPALAGLTQAAALTQRENEIAQLAAVGLSSRAIAERLVIGVRTVDNTLGTVYAKLNITGRDALPDALTQPIDHGL